MSQAVVPACGLTTFTEMQSDSVCQTTVHGSRIKVFPSGGNKTKQNKMIASHFQSPF